LKRIESHAFDGLCCVIVIPCTALFVASDPGISPFLLLFAESDSCERFEWWLSMRKTGISVDLRRILRLGSSFLELRSYLFDNPVIEENSIMCEFEDNSEIVVESVFSKNLMEDGLIEKAIEKLINLCYSCIAAPIGFVFGSEWLEMNVFGLSSESEWLFEIIRANPMWETPTAKAKAIAGLVLGFRFTHSLGLIHGHLTTNNILFDLNHCIQITDFSSCLSGNGLSGFSREGCNPEMDIRGFVSILFEIVVGRPAKEEADIPVDVPMFVSEMIKSRLSGEWRRLSSFLDNFETLKQHNFEI
jgi:serine/threonine protein kinase